MQPFLVTFDCGSFDISIPVKAASKTQARHEAITQANDSSFGDKGITLKSDDPVVSVRLKPVRFRAAMITDVVVAK